MKHTPIFLIFLLILCTTSFARVEKTYIDLLSVDGESLSRQVSTLLKPAANGQMNLRKQRKVLVDALRLTFGRWDQDGFRDKIYQNVRKSTDQETLVQANLILTDEALNALKRKSGSVRDLSTYIIILENLMAQIRPDLAFEDRYLDLFRKVRDAKVKIPENVQKDRRRRGLPPFESPSGKAGVALKENGKKRKKTKRSADPKTPSPALDEPELDLGEELDEEIDIELE